MPLRQQCEWALKWHKLHSVIANMFPQKHQWKTMKLELQSHFAALWYKILSKPLNSEETVTWAWGAHPASPFEFVCPVHIWQNIECWWENCNYSDSYVLMHLSLFSTDITFLQVVTVCGLCCNGHIDTWTFHMCRNKQEHSIHFHLLTDIFEPFLSISLFCFCVSSS